MNWSEMVQYDQSSKVIGSIKSGKVFEIDWNDEDAYNKKLSYTILNKALECGKTDIADVLLSKPGCVVTSDKGSSSLVKKRHNTPLHNAVIRGDWRIVEILLEKKAHIYVCNAENNTPLHLAFFKKDNEIIDKLFAAIESTQKYRNVKNKLGLSLLHIACARNNINVVKKLLGCTVCLKDVVSNSSTMWKGFTALHFAAEYKSLDVIKFLFDKLAGCKADLERKDGYGHTAADIINEQGGDFLVMSDLSPLDSTTNYSKSISNFHVACARDDENVVRKFLNVNAPVNTVVSEKAVFFPKYTPLHLAIKTKNQKTVKALVERGADLNAINDEWMTPLHLALYTEKRGKRSPLVDSLYAATKNKEANPTDKYKLSYLHVASTRNDVNLVNQLLDKNGVDVNSKVSYSVEKNFYNFTPLHFATLYNNVEVARLLLRRGADVDACTNRFGDGTPLHIALFQGHKALIELLLVMGADPKIVRPMSEEGALSLLVHGYIKKQDDQLLPYIEKLIMNCNIDVNSKDRRGDTALHVACERLNSTKPVIKLLLKLGADINAENDKGETPFTLIVQEENQYMVPNADFMMLYFHVQELKAFGLEVSEKNEKCCETLMTKPGVWSIDVSTYSEESLASSVQRRQSEIARMKQIQFVQNLSLYDFVKLEPERAATHKISASNLKTIASIEEEFPIFEFLVKLHLHKIERINSNLEPTAKRQRYS